MDPLSIVAGAVAVLVGWVLRGPSLNRKSKEDTPLCSCGHAPAFHDPKMRECYAEIQRPNRWDSYGEEVGWIWVTCTCQKYDGPEPLASFYPPELT